jgi:hypothetical protein
MVNAIQKTILLLIIADRKFDQDDFAAHQHSLELLATAEKLAAFILPAKPHDMFGTGAVISATIKQNHFTGGRQMYPPLNTEYPPLKLEYPPLEPEYSPQNGLLFASARTQAPQGFQTRFFQGK